MTCSSVNLLFFMSIILRADGLSLAYVGRARREKVSAQGYVVVLAYEMRCTLAAQPVPFRVNAYLP